MTPAFPELAVFLAGRIRFETVATMASARYTCHFHRRYDDGIDSADRMIRRIEQLLA